jgi:uncharacterized protein YdaL
MHWNQVTAHWTGKSGSAFKVNINVKSFAFLGKGDADYLPRVIDAESKTEKFFWLHVRRLWILKYEPAFA